MNPSFNLRITCEAVLNMGTSFFYEMIESKNDRSRSRMDMIDRNGITGDAKHYLNLKRAINISETVKDTRLLSSAKV